MFDRFGSHLGRPISVTRLPTLVLRTLGVLSPVVREVVEMTYQWTQPFVVDDRAFRARFGLSPTPLDEAIGSTLAWAERTYAPPRAA